VARARPEGRPLSEVDWDRCDASPLSEA
jgi:hypothetical protein